MPELTEIVSAIRRCRVCVEAPRGRPLPHEPRPVLRVSTAARLAICGQAPGTRVHRSGKPFTDPSGDRLRSWLNMSPELFYDEARIAIIPMGFCFPGTGKSGDLPPRPECAEAWREQLLNLLPKIELTLVIGQYAHKYHLANDQKKTLTETVKAWKEYWNKGLLPLPHPSPRNNIWLRNNAWFEKAILPTLKSRVKNLIK